jgi:hypothetical protein
MPIRFAQLADVPALVAGGKRMHALTRFKHFDYNEAKVAHSFTELIAKGQHKYGFLVAENGEGAGRRRKSLPGSRTAERATVMTAWIAGCGRYQPVQRTGYGRQTRSLDLQGSPTQWAATAKQKAKQRNADRAAHRRATARQP